MVSLIQIGKDIWHKLNGLRSKITIYWSFQGRQLLSQELPSQNSVTKAGKLGIWINGRENGTSNITYDFIEMKIKFLVKNKSSVKSDNIRKLGVIQGFRCCVRSIFFKLLHHLCFRMRFLSAKEICVCIVTFWKVFINSNFLTEPWVFEYFLWIWRSQRFVLLEIPAKAE